MKDFSTRFGENCDNLKIDYRANLLMVQHKVLDRVREAVKHGTKIGTTGKGIGPCYEDVPGRRGLIINDLYNENRFETALRKNLRHNNALLADLERQRRGVVGEVLEADDLLNGRFYKETQGWRKIPDFIFGKKDFFDVREITNYYLELGNELKGFIKDTEIDLREGLGNKNILLEGAQGLLLAVKRGSQPYQTSSDPTIRGLASGVGISQRDIDLVLGIYKGLYMTRVGDGPFPTEFGGTHSEKWCREHTKYYEKPFYRDVTVNDANKFKVGMAVRDAGGEYGATTGRLRRTGRLDLPLLRRAKLINGPNFIATKLDVLDEMNVIQICDYYTYNGPDYWIGGRLLRKGTNLNVAYMDTEVLKHCNPHYMCVEGWKENTTGITEYKKLPMQMKKVLQWVDGQVGGLTHMYSVGPQAEQTILGAAYHAHA